MKIVVKRTVSLVLVLMLALGLGSYVFAGEAAPVTLAAVDAPETLDYQMTQGKALPAFPDSLQAYGEDAAPYTVPVAWQCGTKPAEPGSYLYTATLPETYVLAEGLELPSIMLTVLAAEPVAPAAEPGPNPPEMEQQEAPAIMEEAPLMFAAPTETDMMCLAADALPSVPLFQMTFTIKQVLDCSRSPAFPTPGQNFAVSRFGAPFSSLTSKQVNPDDYQAGHFAFSWADGATETDTQLKLAYYENGAEKEVFADSGYSYGIFPQGFFYSAGRFGYLLSFEERTYGEGLDFGVASHGKIEKLEDLMGYNPIGVKEPTLAKAGSNSIQAASGLKGKGTKKKPYTVTAGKSFSLKAAGDRQAEAGETVGDTRFIPTKWDVNPSGSFPAGGPYVIKTKIKAAGTYTLTITYAEEKWDGGSWGATGNTDTKTAVIRVDEAASAASTPPASEPAASEATPAADPAPAPANTNGVPQTGDTATPYAAATLLAALGAVLCLLARRKQAL